jgi:chromosome segregation ATPase
MTQPTPHSTPNGYEPGLQTVLEPILLQLQNQDSQIQSQQQQITQLHQENQNLQQQLAALISALQPLPPRLTTLEQKLDGMSRQGKSSHRQVQAMHNQLAAILPLNQEEQRVQIQEAIALLTQQRNEHQNEQKTQKSHHRENQQSLNALLDLLMTFNERMTFLETRQTNLQSAVSAPISRQEQQLKTLLLRQQDMNQQMTKFDRKLPQPLTYPRKLVLDGEVVTYRGMFLIMGILLLAITGTSSVLNRLLMPDLQQQTYGRVNNIEKRLERIEKWVKP